MTKKDLKILLVFEKFSEETLSLRVGSEKLEKLGLEYIGALLEQNNYTYDLLDNDKFERNGDSISNEINYGNYDIIGFSATAGNIRQTLQTVENIKTDSIIILGGISPSLHYREILKDNKKVTGIVLGDGELPFLDIVHTLESNSDLDSIMNLATHKNLSPLLRKPLDLDVLPQVKHKSLENNDKALITTSKGCRFHCSFCAVTKFYNKYASAWRGRSIKNISDEIEFLVNKKQTSYIWITDVDFIGYSKERIFNLCNELEKRELFIPFEIDSRVDDIEIDLYKKLKSVGLSTVFLGIESMSNAFLERVNKCTTKEQNIKAIKILDDLGIYVSLGLILFDEDTTFKELKENIDFLKEYGFEHCGNPILQSLKNYNFLETPSLPVSFKDPIVHKIYKEATDLERQINTEQLLTDYKELENRDPKKIPLFRYNYKNTIGNLLFEIIQNYETS